MPLARNGQRVEISKGIYVESRDRLMKENAQLSTSKSEFFLVVDSGMDPIGFDDIQELKRQILKFNLNLNQQKLREFVQDISA